jgi:hypothetical protein
MTKRIKPQILRMSSSSLEIELSAQKIDINDVRARTEWLAQRLGKKVITLGFKRYEISEIPDSLLVLAHNSLYTRLNRRYSQAL